MQSNQIVLNISLKKYFFLLFIVFATNLFSQQNQVYNHILYDFNKAIGYYQLEEYANADAFFNRVLKKTKSFPNPEVETYQKEAQFYCAIIALKMGKSQAENLLQGVFQKTIDQMKREELSFHLAEYYFDKGQFKDAEPWFENTSTEWMNEREMDRFYFKKAFNHMKNNQMEKAIRYFDESINFSKTTNEELSCYYNGTILFNQKNYDASEKYLNKIQKSTNSKLDIAYILGQIHYINKKYTEVVQLNEPKITEDNDSKKERLLLVGKSYFELKRFDKAALYLSQYINKTDKVTPEEMYQLAFSEYKNKNYTQAISYFKELQQSSQDFSPYAMYALADCYLKSGEKNNARLAFISASKFDIDSIIKEESYFNISKLNFELNNFSQAIATAKNYLSLYPNSTYKKEAYKIMAQSLMAAKDYPQAIELIEKNQDLVQGNEKLYQEICYAYAVNLFNNNDYPMALKFLNKAIKNPFDKNIAAEAMYLKSEILFKQREYDLAKESYTNTYRFIQNENILYNKNASFLNTLYGLGYSEYLEKNYQSALLYFQNSRKHISLKPEKDEENVILDIQLRIADLYFLTRNYDSAYQNYQKFITNKSKSIDYALLQKATIDGIWKKNKDKINTLKDLISNYPKSMYVDDANYQLGLAYEDDKNFDLAIKEYNDIIKTKPKSPFAPKSHLRIATISLNSNKTEQALKYYTNIIEQYPNAAEADQALKGIKEIYTLQGRLDEYISWIQKLPNGKEMAVSTQDSLLFDAGETFYAEGNCEKAQNYFIKYLNLFPEGIFSKKAHFYRAECYLKNKQIDDAIMEYGFLSAINNNPYYESSNIQLAYLFFNFKKDYEKALIHYQKTYEIASSAKNQILSRLGIMICSYQAKKYEDALQTALNLEKETELPEIYKYESKYYIAMSHYWLGNKRLAEELLLEVSKEKNNIKSAESAYYYALTLFEKNESKKSNDFLFKAKDDFASYEYWVIKYFILIAQNYNQMKDYFQAQATLESIINNYKGDQNLILEAKKRLAEVEKNAKSKSKVNYEIK